MKASTIPLTYLFLEPAEMIMLRETIGFSKIVVDTKTREAIHKILLKNIVDGGYILPLLPEEKEIFIQFLKDVAEYQIAPDFVKNFEKGVREVLDS
jgi:hypothetical protein